jgi:hypothetical protein
LNGAGCAAAVPAVSVEANNKATTTCVFTDASLLSWISSGLIISAEGSRDAINPQQCQRRLFQVARRGHDLPDHTKAELAPDHVGAQRRPFLPGTSIGSRFGADTGTKLRT